MRPRDAGPPPCSCRGFWGPLLLLGRDQLREICGWLWPGSARTSDCSVHRKTSHTNKSYGMACSMKVKILAHSLRDSGNYLPKPMLLKASCVFSAVKWRDQLVCLLSGGVTQLPVVRMQEAEISKSQHVLFVAHRKHSLHGELKKKEMHSRTGKSLPHLGAQSAANSSLALDRFSVLILLASHIIQHNILLADTQDPGLPSLLILTKSVCRLYLWSLCMLSLTSKPQFQEKSWPKTFLRASWSALSMFCLPKQ